MKEALFRKLQYISEQNVSDIENAKENGRKVVGFYCLYAPMEMAVAVDAIPLPLCGTRNDPIHFAEERLPRNLCPLIKSSYGFALSDTCPFFRYSDMIIADTTCDGKKKMFELMTNIKPVHVLQLPHNQKSGMAAQSWLSEIERLKRIIETACNFEMTDQKLQNAIRLMNRERMAKKALMDLCCLNPSPITGMELLTILFRTGFLADKEKGISLMEEITQFFKKLSEDGLSVYSRKNPRILITGVPVGLGSEKVIKILEESGASVVCFENCSGYKQVFQVDETIDPIEALARQYLSIPCSVMSPNPERFKLLRRLVQSFSVNGVVDLTWQACHTYNVEAYSVEKFVEEDCGLPYLHLETDYSASDTEQLRVRIEAFLEMI